MRIKLDLPLKVSEIVKAVSGIYKNTQEQEIVFVCTDSREVEKGDLFIALEGKRYNGEDFTDEALSVGAIPLSKRSLDGVIAVKNTYEALGKLTKLYKSKLPKLKKVAAITGSIGKTTTKEFAFVILSEQFTVAKSIGNYNNFLGLCLSILSSGRNTEILLLEMGMNSLGEISALSKIAEPDVAIITNIGSSHVGRLGSREKIAEAKLEILDGMKEKKLILPFGEKLLPYSDHISYSTENEKSDYYIRREYGRIDLYYGERWLLNATFSIDEKHLTSCLAPAITLCCELGVPISKIRSGIKKIDRSSVRAEFINTAGLTLYSDCYNASPESVGAALEYIASLSEYPDKSAVLGSIMELGEMSEIIHKKIGAMAVKAGCRQLYFLGYGAPYMKDGAIEEGYTRDRIHLFTEKGCHRDAADEILKNSKKGELILFKGSRAMKLEAVIEAIKEMSKKKEE